MSESEQSISVFFMHPTDGRLLEVDVDPDMTAGEAVNNLLDADFVQPSSEGYNLGIKGGAIIRRDQTLRDAGVEGGKTLRVISAADAGMARG